MINFPEWAISPKRISKRLQAFKILRFLVVRASFQHHPEANVTEFAKDVGMDRTTILLYMKQGKFSRRSADRAEAFYGPELIQADWLVNPLSLLEVK